MTVDRTINATRKLFSRCEQGRLICSLQFAGLDRSLNRLGARGARLLALVPNIGGKLPILADLLPDHDVFARNLLRRRFFGL
jgi:hypothetical protein